MDLFFLGLKGKIFVNGTVFPSAKVKIAPPPKIIKYLFM